MKKLYGFLSVIITITMVIILADCKKDDSPSLKKLNLTGYAQKGPFINGSSVTVYDLQSDLSPTGKSYNAQIMDNIGEKDSVVGFLPKIILKKISCFYRYPLVKAG